MENLILNLIQLLMQPGEQMPVEIWLRYVRLKS